MHQGSKVKERVLSKHVFFVFLVSDQLEYVLAMEILDKGIDNSAKTEEFQVRLQVF